jgi:hypothetical protein
MGLGRSKDGKFDLILSIRHNADATRIEQWERSFRRASEILYDATDGQMQFGRLYVANNSAGSNAADGFLLEEEGGSASNRDALGTPGLHMGLKSDEKNKPFIVIHEFGHYGLGMYDEYETAGGGGAVCTGDPDTGACIMEFGWTQGDQIDDEGNLTEGPVNEFCTDDDHDPDNDTEQQALLGESCWETIEDNYPDVTIPVGLPDAPEPAGHDPVEWILLNEVPRFALVLDKSGSMSANNAIEGVRYGADYWVNYLSQTGDQLSVIMYDHGQDVLLPLTLLEGDTDLSATLADIAALSPGGSTNIGGAMVEGVSQIMSPGDQAATQVMVIFSDGLHNTGTPPESVVDELVENGIRAYTIGFGPFADQDRLQQIAEDTGGRFEQIDADADTMDAQLEIQNYLIEISGEVREGSGIITMMPGLLPEPSESELRTIASTIRLRYTKHCLQRIARLPLGVRARSKGFDHRAYVERGSARATFVVSYKQHSSVQFYLIRPDGQVVDPNNDPDVTFVNPGKSPYAFYVVNNPDAGFWVMRVVRGQARGAIPFKVFAFSENRNITIGIKGTLQVYKALDTVKLGTQVYYQVALTGLRNPVARIIPQDYSRRKSRSRKVQRVSLKERLARVARDDAHYKRVVRVPNGFYEGEIRFDEPGSYSVELVFANTGKATEAVGEAERPVQGDKQDTIPPPPPFMRVKRFQIHVGPLPKGMDVESSPQRLIPDKFDSLQDVLTLLLSKLKA